MCKPDVLRTGPRFYTDVINRQYDSVFPYGGVVSGYWPSGAIPRPGALFRIEYKTINDRSYVDVIFRCIEVQNNAVVGERVWGGWSPDLKYRKFFTLQDVRFIPADKLAAALLGDSDEDPRVTG